MQSTPTHDEADQEARPGPSGQRRLVWLLVVLLTVLLLTFIPPLVNVSRFQLRIARNISASVGRPVHFKQLSMNLLPLPGFTLEDFVVEEDPGFGSEPILRADEVRVTLRISSLWRGRVEFSKIALTEPTSVNLVHRADGRWNIEGLLLEASQIQAAPTAQPYAGAARRFPYIEATGARLNLKLDQEKTPFSLTDAEFAVWLTEPHQWHLRLEAHPARTDTSPGDTGTLRIEGTLGGAGIPTGSLAQVPIDLHGDWREAQLGGLSQLLSGREAGVRGDFSASFSVRGTIGANAIATSFELAKARRASFVPTRPLSLEARCSANAQNTFHTFSSIECHWPPADSSDASVLIVSAEVPDIRQLDSATASVTLPALPEQTLLDWLSVATPHPPTGLGGNGTLAGAVTWHPQSEAADAEPGERRRLHGTMGAKPEWAGDLEFSGAELDAPGLGPRPVPLGDILLRSTPLAVVSGTHARGASGAETPAGGGFELMPVALALGGKQPAILEGHFDASGYTLHLTGSIVAARLLALGDAVPQFGDGLRQLLEPGVAGTADAVAKSPAEPPGRTASSELDAAAEEAAQTPVHLDLTATRAWGGAQVWRESATASTHPVKRD